MPQSRIHGGGGEITHNTPPSGPSLSYLAARPATPAALVGIAMMYVVGSSGCRAGPAHVSMLALVVDHVGRPRVGLLRRHQQEEEGGGRRREGEEAAPSAGHVCWWVGGPERAVPVHRGVDVMLRC